MVRVYIVSETSCSFETFQMFMPHFLLNTTCRVVTLPDVCEGFINMINITLQHTEHMFYVNPDEK